MKTVGYVLGAAAALLVSSLSFGGVHPASFSSASASTLTCVHGNEEAKSDGSPGKRLKVTNECGYNVVVYYRNTRLEDGGGGMGMMFINAAASDETDWFKTISVFASCKGDDDACKSDARSIPLNGH